MTTTLIKDLTNLGNIAPGDKLVAERVDGTTVRVTFRNELADDTSPQLGGNLDLNGYNIGAVTPTEIGYVSGVTSAIQTQIDGKSPTAGNTSLITVGTVTTGTWQATPVTVAYGGSGRTTATAYAPLVGGTTSTGAHQSVASAGTTGQLLVSQGASAIPTWTTPTYPTTSVTSGKILQSDGTNIVASTPTWPTAASTSGKRVKSDGTNLVMSTTTMPDAGTSGKLIRGDGTNYSETTATFADTYTASNLLYSNGANTVTGLATANSGVLVTSGAGVPSIATDIPTAVTIGGAAIYRVGGTDVSVSDGGTGVSSTTAYAVLCGGTTSTGALQSIVSVGTSGQVLTSNGAGALPTFQSAGANTGRLIGFQLLTSGTSATYTRSGGVTAILVEAWGAGGGGGGCDNSSAMLGAAGGGGSGGYCRKYYSSAASTYTYTIGAAGTAGAAAAGTGGTGGSTTFDVMTAGGGAGGVGATAVSGTITQAWLGGAGGTSSGGDVNLPGCPGGFGIIVNVSGGGTTASGMGGCTALGGGGISRVTTAGSTQNAGAAATANTGAGGSGANGQSSTTDVAGGAGGSGLVIVWEFS